MAAMAVSREQEEQEQAAERRAEATPAAAPPTQIGRMPAGLGNHEVAAWAPRNVVTGAPPSPAAGNAAFARWAGAGGGRGTLARTPAAVAEEQNQSVQPDHTPMYPEGEEQNQSVPVSVSGWSASTSPGPNRPQAGAPGGDRLWTGDTIEIRATLSGTPHEPATAAIDDPSGLTSDAGGGAEGTTHVFKRKVEKPGHITLACNLTADGQTTTETFEFNAVTDHATAVALTGHAISLWDRKVADAEDANVRASMAFEEARATFEGAMNAWNETEKFNQDMFIGIILAGVGGALGAGSVLGAGLAKPAEDAVKDTVKFTFRTLAGTAVSGIGKASVGRDRKGAALGKSPFRFFLDNQARINAVYAGVSDVLLRTEDGLLTDTARQSPFLEGNPAEAVAADTKLDEITAGLVEDKAFYLNALWETWLATYGERYIGQRFDLFGYKSIDPGLMIAADSLGFDIRAYAKGFPANAQATASKAGVGGSPSGGASAPAATGTASPASKLANEAGM
jgi:hypothetical protein